ncbi:uncharacterized protein LOC117122768 [Anneissia japonica]|uniref:uncharacterized protein LOC117122768 n=1 Tax=Anneissia japonica TaxID=1529436 RepID=UPI0014255D01|nr:uncharacterized protein LOC117122768 [Anneissia japonica]
MLRVLLCLAFLGLVFAQRPLRPTACMKEYMKENNCTKKWKPVCASNSASYRNKCEMEAFRKCESRFIYQIHDGTCGIGQQTSCKSGKNWYKYSEVTIGKCGQPCFCAGGRRRWACVYCYNVGFDECSEEDCGDVPPFCPYGRMRNSKGCLTCECLPDYSFYLRTFYWNLYT